MKRRLTGLELTSGSGRVFRLPLDDDEGDEADRSSVNDELSGREGKPSTSVVVMECAGFMGFDLSALYINLH